MRSGALKRAAVLLTLPALFASSPSRLFHPGPPPGSGAAFVAVSTTSNGKGLYSPDGITWSNTTLPSISLAAVTWCKGAGLYIAVGSNGTLTTSPDGKAWTDRSGTLPNGVSTTWRGITANATTCVAVGTDGGGNGWVASSTDGITWTGSAPNAAWLDGRTVCWDGTNFIAAGTSGPTRVVTSPDGNTWSLSSTGFATATGNAIACTASLAVLTRGSTTIATSANHGSTWTARTVLPFAAWNGTYAVAVSGGTFCVVDSTTQSSTSTDGITWSTAGVKSNGSPVGFTSGLGLFVLGQASNIQTSPDGLTWTTRSTAAGSWTLAFKSG